MTAARPRPPSARVAASTTSLLLAAVALGSACSKGAKPSAGLEVVISSDLSSPQGFDGLAVSVSQETSPGVFGAPLLDETKSVPQGVTLPASVAITAGTSGDQVARIVVRALEGQTPVVERTAQVQIPSDRVLELDLFLASACENVACKAATTCIAGTCQNAIVDDSQLHPYQPSEVGPTTGGDAGWDPTCGSGGCPMPSPQSCTPSSCSGCCDPAGNCLPGNSPSACGANGATCQTCSGGSWCNAGGCSQAPSAPCGDLQQACCTNTGSGTGCNGQANCVSGVCQACGQSGESCCGGGTPGYCSGPNLTCNPQFVCEPCGGQSQACCGGQTCSAGLTCDGTTCAPQCGLAGNACCPYDQCNQGCCENGVCTGQGSTCAVYSGVCANGSCQGGTCGGQGQPCCTSAAGAAGCTGPNSVCVGGMCQSCGIPGGGVYANCCPGDACGGFGSTCSHDADAGAGGDPDAGYCVPCGGYQQPCCQPSAAGASGFQGSTPCQTGYSCSSGLCL